MKILFIGNSYTYYNDLPVILEKLAKENGIDVEAHSVLCGGRRLIENLEKQDEYAEKLNGLLAEHVFDHVILQEHSVGSLLYYEDFCKGITGLRDKIGEKGKKYLLYETWGRKEGSPTLEENGWTRESMTFGIADAYRKAGKALNFPVSYVGLKFFAVGQCAPEIELFAPDLTHPSYEGSCLAAITLYVSLFRSYPAKTESLSLPENVLKVFRMQF